MCVRAARAAQDLLVCTSPVHYGFNDLYLDPGHVKGDSTIPGIRAQTRYF